MEKTWFIFQSDHHLGPFSTDEVTQMLQSGSIDVEVPLWREGVNDWFPLRDFEEFLPPAVEEFFAESFPDLPELPELPSLPEIPEEIIDIQDFEEEIEAPSELPELEEDLGELDFPILPDLPELPIEIKSEGRIVEVEDLPEVPTVEVYERLEVEEAVANIVVETPQPETITIVERVPEPERPEVRAQEKDIWSEIDSEVEKKKVNYKLISAVASCLVILVLSGFLIFQSTRSSVNLDEFSAITIERIEEVKKSEFESGVQAEVFMSKDSKELILAANIPHKAKVYLTLSSVQNKVIADERIVVTSMGMLIGGVAKYSELKIVKGSQFASGEYYIQLLAIPTGVKQKALAFLYSKFSFKLFKPAEQVRYRGKSLIFPGTKEDFDKSIYRYKEELLVDKRVPYEHLLEGYRTFSTLASKVYKTYEEVLTSIRRGKDIESFEILYSKNMGPVLQGLMTDTHKQLKSYEISDPKIASKFEELLEQGKRIGEMSSDMVTMTKKVNRLRKKNRDRLMKLFIKRSLFLQETSKSKAFEAETELKRLKL